MKRLRLIIPALFALVLIGACSVAGLAYNNAPFAATYYVDDWVSLTREQRAWLKPRVESLMAWHRTNELPQYQRLIDGAMRQVEKPPLAEDVSALYEESRRAVERLCVKAMPDMVAFFGMLEPAQWNAMAKKFDAENEKLVRELRLSEQERRENRVKRYVGRYEDWMGTLSPAQREVIRKRVDGMPLSESLRLADRKRWQGDFIRLLQSRPDAATLERELRVLLLAPEQRRAPAYREQWEMQQKAVQALTTELLREATPRQQQAVKNKLAGYASDVANLVRS